MFYKFIRALLFLPIKFFYPTKVIGKKNLLKERCILYSNHKSNLDAIIIGINVKQKISFLSKIELFKTKLSKWFYTKIGAIPVNRGKADIGAIKQVLTLLKNGGTLGIFPGGTRQKNEGEEEEYKNGVTIFAVKGKAPVIPMVFLNKPKLFKKNVLIIGKPFYLENETGKLEKEYLDKSAELLKLKQQELIELYNKGEF
ncbi:MAG: lysophospholipid acyltransferase family protein [Spirochaetales bacterium]